MNKFLKFFKDLYEKHIDCPYDYSTWERLKSKYFTKHHLLDLRINDPDHPDHYEFGYYEPISLVNFMAYKVLEKYAKEDAKNIFGPITQKDIDEADEFGKSCLIRQKANSEEIETLWKYFSVGRKEMKKVCDESLSNWAREKEKLGDGDFLDSFNKHSPEADRLFEINRTLDEEFYQTEEEMLIRLIKIRRALWS